MTNPVGVKALSPGELALQLCSIDGTIAYAAYLVPESDIDTALEDLEAELQISTSGKPVLRISATTGDQLVAELADTSIQFVVADVRSFTKSDWALLDRRRSSLAHRGVLVFVTTSDSFDELMRTTVSLASSLGAEVFAFPVGASTTAADREKRLAALRAWAEKTDDEVVDLARKGTLARDPEFAEWLVLLGHGELLDPGTS